MSPARFSSLQPAALVLLLVCLCFATSPSESAELDWLDDYDHALEAAAFLRQPVLVNFWAGWCAFCLRMDEQVFVDPRIAGATADVVTVRVLADRQPRLVFLHGVRDLPFLVLLDRTGAEVGRARGYLGVPELLDALQLARARSNRLDGRMQAFEQAPGDPARRLRLADELLAQGDAAAALHHLEELGAARHAGWHGAGDALLDSATALGSLARPAEAIARARLYLAQARRPREVEARLRLGGWLLELGDVEAARAELVRVIEHAPDSWKARHAARLLRASRTGAPGSE